MRVSLLLLLYAVVLATVGAALLRRAWWVQRAPRLGILAWQVLTGSIVASALLAGLALAVPSLPIAATLAEFAHACVTLIQAQYATPAGVATATTGLVIVGAVVGRLAFCMVQGARAAATERRRHRRALALVGRPEHRLGAIVIPHDVPEVYCLPGRRRRIVLTSAALDTLSADQLAAVLAHERAHLRARHDLVIAAASALAQAFPRVPPFALAHDQIRRLVELAADDVAAGSSDRLMLAEGILTVAGGHTPPAALGAGSTAGAARVRRLLAPRHRLGVLGSVVVSAALAAVLAIPVWLAVSPAVAAADAIACPLPPAFEPSTQPSS
ncbi:MAG: M56 family metallopeptidase [Jiangellaceae bacterium]